MNPHKIRIGSRGSPLALWQANWIKSLLESAHPGLAVEIIRIKTSGDKIQDVPLAKIGGKGLFTKEIEESLLCDEVDIAVHSMKDVPIKLPAGLEISVITEREDPRDALISRNGLKLADLPQGARVGTGSLRRTTQLLHFRPDLKVKAMRGNVETRLKKMDSEGMDAVILAAAGLNRLEMNEKITERIDPARMLPGIGQGAVGIESRQGDLEVLEAILALNHEPTQAALEAERAFLTRLEGGCQVPIAGYATVDAEAETFHLRGLVGSLDGTMMVQAETSGSWQEAAALGDKLGREILHMGADRILKEIYEA